MKKIKKALSVMLVVVIMLTATPLSGFMGLEFPEWLDFSMEVRAAETNDDSSAPISVTVTTDSSSYGAMEYANITVEIINNGTKTVDNVSAIGNFDDLVPIGNKLSLYVDGESIEPGGALYYGYKVSIQPSRLNFLLNMFLSIKNFFSGKCSVPNVNFNDGRETSSDTIEISFGGKTVSETVTVWYDYETEIVEPESEEEFDTEIMTLVAQTMLSEDFDIEEAKSNALYAKRIIVKLVDNAKIDFAKFNPDTIVYGDDNVVVLQFATEELTEYCYNSLVNNNSVIYIELDEIVSTSSFGVSTAATSSQTSNSNISWGESYINADDYAKHLANNEYYDLVTVAVVDTGVDMDHPYLEGRILSSGKDFIDGDSNPEDENGHGTHVAGIVVDCTNNINVKIMPVRVLDANGYNYKSSVSRGIHYAVNNGADVINLSLGGTESRYIDEAIEKALEEDIVVCVAAGNGDPANNNQAIDTESVCPAHMDNVIVVGALQQDGNVAYFSNYGDSVDVVAPGVSILSAYLNGDYEVLSGTSMATPHVAAIVAMVRLKYPSYSCEDIENFIKNYCRDLGDEGKDKHYGFGVIDVYNAIPDCTIQYENNNGINVDNVTVKDGDEVKVPALTKTYTVTFVSDGNVVSKKYPESIVEGWYEKSDYTGTSYAPDSVYMAKSNITLFAKWKNSTLGTLPTANKTYYIFVGWFDAQSGGKQYTSNSEITKDITLYAHWREDLVTIPNVIGQSYTNAKATLEGLGFNVIVASDYNDNVSYTLVYAQSATGQLRRGSTITITYSLGRRAFYVGEYVIWSGGEIRQNVNGTGNIYYKEPCGMWITDLSYWYKGVEYVGISYGQNSSRFGWVPISTISHA